jgi:hypothetical protein
MWCGGLPEVGGYRSECKEKDGVVGPETQVLQTNTFFATRPAKGIEKLECRAPLCLPRALFGEEQHVLCGMRDDHCPSTYAYPTRLALALPITLGRKSQVLDALQGLPKIERVGLHILYYATSTKGRIVYR